jgi:hypothetical protein
LALENRLTPTFDYQQPVFPAYNADLRLHLRLSDAPTRGFLRLAYVNPISGRPIYKMSWRGKVEQEDDREQRTEDRVRGLSSVV